MGQAGRFLRRIGSAQGYTGAGYSHYCPACDSMHAFAVDAPFSNGAIWTFNNDLAQPSFTPSMNIRTGRFADPSYRVEPGEEDDSAVCHYFVSTGAQLMTADPTMRGGDRAPLDPAKSYIRYLGDCTHALRGETVELPELPPQYRDH